MLSLIYGQGECPDKLTNVNPRYMMPSWRKKLTPYYDLADIQKLVRSGGLEIAGTALRSARTDFGWRTSHIVDAMCSLKARHYYKSELHNVIPGIIVDVYKVRKLKGESVYLHFHIDYEDSDKKIILNSFKELEE